MAFNYENVGQFGDRQAAENWAKRNNIDPRDLHFRETGRGVDVGVRKNIKRDDGYDDGYGNRRHGFFR